MSVALGIGFEIGATLVGTIGKQLVSCSARVDNEGRACVLRSVGLAVTSVLGPILDTSAYAFAPQSLIAPLNGLDIVWNTLSAPCTLGEKLTAKHVLGTVLIFCGASASSALGPHTDHEVTVQFLQEIRQLPAWRALCYWLAVSLIFGGLVPIQSTAKRICQPFEQQAPEMEESEQLDEGSVVWAGSLSGIGVSLVEDQNIEDNTETGDSSDDFLAAEAAAARTPSAPRSLAALAPPQTLAKHVSPPAPPPLPTTAVGPPRLTTTSASTITSISSSLAPCYASG